MCTGDPRRLKMVRKQYSTYMEQISTDPENMIVLKIVKELLQTQKDVMLVCSYIPPYDSIYWKKLSVQVWYRTIGAVYFRPA